MLISLELLGDFAYVFLFFFFSFGLLCGLDNPLTWLSLWFSSLGEILLRFFFGLPCGLARPLTWLSLWFSSFGEILLSFFDLFSVSPVAFPDL